MELSDEMNALLDAAETTVQGCLKERGDFSTFALVMRPDGEIAVVAGEEADRLGDAIGSVLKAILPMVDRNEVTATLICAPIDAEVVADNGWRAAMFDIEDRNLDRAYVVMPFRQRDYGGWAYRPLEYSRGVSQVFGGAARRR